MAQILYHQTSAKQKNTNLVINSAGCIEDHFECSHRYPPPHGKLSTLFGVSHFIIKDKTITLTFPYNIVKTNAINVACKWQVTSVWVGWMSVKNWQGKWLECAVSDTWILPNHKPKCAMPCFDIKYEFPLSTDHISHISSHIYFFGNRDFLDVVIIIIINSINTINYNCYYSY